MVQSKLFKLPRSQDARHAIVVGSTLLVALAVFGALFSSA
jgi:hypothetical protein